MAKKKTIKKDLSHMSLAAVVNELNAKYGLNTLALASKAKGLHLKFLSTGSYALDFTLGGGIPENRMTEIRGPFSSLKSTICYSVIRNFQVRYPAGYAFFEDGEKSFDPVYAEQIGIDLDRLVLINAESGEQAVDVLSEVIRVGTSVLVVVDSIASLVPTAEIESSMDQQFQGLHPRLINRMFRTMTAAIKRSMYDATAPTATLLATNQIREKIGVVYGNPETTPGGRGKDFYYSVIIKFNSSPSDRIMEKVTRNGVERNLRVGQQVRFTIQKNKTGGSQFEEGSFDFYVRHYKGHAAFSFNNEAELFHYGSFFGLIKGDKKHKYCYPGIATNSESHFKKTLLSDEAVQLALYEDILQAMRNDSLSTIMSSVDQMPDEDLAESESKTPTLKKKAKMRKLKK